MMRRIAVLLAVVVVYGAGSHIDGDQTKATDKVLPFELEYFVGTWAFDWTVPETPVGPAGDLVGTEIYRLLDPSASIEPLPGFPMMPPGLLPERPRSAQVLEGRIEGVGPSGAIKRRTVLVYDAESGQATRYEIDQAGVVVVKRGAITGDLGGIYTFTWETGPLDRAGRQVQFKGRTVAFSPRNFREFIQFSADGGSFATYGQPWYRKQSPD